MLETSGMLVVRRRSLKKRHKTVMSSRLERLPEKTAQSSDLTSAGCFVCLLGAVAYVVMSTKKKVNAVVKKSSATKRAKKVRSISMSLDLECPGRIPYGSYRFSPQEPGVIPFKKPVRPPHADRNRTVSACEFVEQYLAKESLSKSDLMVRLGNLSNSTNLKRQEEKFPFDLLPPDCKLKVFTFLGTHDRGVASKVCTEWRALIKTSSLWNIVNLTDFSLCPQQSSSNHECSELCYALYRQKVKKFFQYMCAVRPVMKNLRFSFDIGDFKDGWLDCIQMLLDSARCQDLEIAHLNWKESPNKPFCRDSITWSTSDYNELMHRQRHRQRLFVNFFDRFTAAAPNISDLTMPFDWSHRSIQSLCRLQKLESLVLEKYFVFQTLEQVHLDQLFAGLTSIRSLVLEIWTPSGRGLLLYSLESPKLEFLDISQSRGFYLRDVDMPALKVFKVSRHSWNGPLATADAIHLPCILDVMRAGMPSLRQLNDHVLQPDWKDHTSTELEAILKSVCSCSKHKTSCFL